MNQIKKNNFISSEEALQKLKEGNLRFVKNWLTDAPVNNHEKRVSLLASQRPFAIILSCSDSRAPSEILFDQGLGDLFVIRVAGNIVAPSIIGSVEFAAATFETPLVVVMGHTRCGAVTATYDTVKNGHSVLSVNIHDIVDRIKPSVESVLESGSLDTPREIQIQNSIHANIRSSVQQLKFGSKILENLCKNNKLQIIGAEYSLETGIVEFFK